MLVALLSGQLTVPIAILIIIAIIIALSFHEFGHAVTAKLFGDDTAERAGRLTINPMVHIDPMGLLMVVMVGFGYAKPVPTDPRNFTSKLASPLVAFAGPAMNLLLAFVAVNLWGYGMTSGIDALIGPGQSTFFYYFVSINLLLFLFNLLPIGPLDGHYIAEYVLPRPWDYHYHMWNAKYGGFILIALIVVSIMGFPIFRMLANFAQQIIPYIQFIN